MARGSISVGELEQHFKLPPSFLDKECTEEHVRELALLLESWELLASHLGLTKQQIETIKADSDKHEVRKENVLARWRETFAFKATYRKLLEVLLNISRTDLACKVCELLTQTSKHGLQHLPSHPEHSLSTMTSQHVTPLPPTSLPRKRTDSMCSNNSLKSHKPSLHNLFVSKFTTISEVEEVFQDIVVSVEEHFEENVPLVKLQRYSCHLPVNLKGQFGQLLEERISRIWNAKTVGELFVILSYFWDYLYPDMLSYLVNRFGNKQMIDQINVYINKLSQFRENVRIPDYIGERRINLVADDYTPIIAMFGDEWCEKTLADLEEVRCDFSKKFSFLRLLPKMNGLKYNSIVVIFSVPKLVQFDTEKLCKFFKSYSVLKLMVGGVCIYDDGPTTTQFSDQTEASLPVYTLVEDNHMVAVKPGIKERANDTNHQDVDPETEGPKELIQFGGFTCEFVEKPPKGVEFSCPVCLLTLCEPYQVTCCGYSFCRLCIEHLKIDDKLQCPTCNEKNIMCYPNKGLERSLNDFHVYCTYKDKGCEWAGELRQLEKHLNKNPPQGKELEGCLFTRVDCKFKSVGCEVKPARREISTHLIDHSTVHLQLLQISKSPLSETFIQAQQQIAKLSQQLLEVKSKGFAVSDSEKSEQGITHLNKYIAAELELAEVMDQHHKELSTMREQYKQQLTSIYAGLSKITEKYEQLRDQVHHSNQSNMSVIKHTPMSSGTPTLPITLTLNNFDILKKDDVEWRSPPFYTHPHGYKMCLSVYLNGTPNSECHGTHVSIYIRLKKGRFDVDLEWPFRGEIEISLLDQKEKQQHHSEEILFDDSVPDDIAGRVIEGNTAELGWGYHFISHSDLCTKYLKNNCILLQIVNLH